MKFDTKENAFVRKIVFDDVHMDDGTQAGQFCIRFANGEGFAMRTPVKADITPLVLASIFEDVAAAIKTRYKLEAK